MSRMFSANVSLCSLISLKVLLIALLCMPSAASALAASELCPDTGWCDDLDHNGDGDVGHDDYRFHFYVCGMTLKDFGDFQICFGPLE